MISISNLLWRVVEVCREARAENGGIMAVMEVQKRVEKGRGIGGGMEVSEYVQQLVRLFTNLPGTQRRYLTSGRVSQAARLWIRCHKTGIQANDSICSQRAQPRPVHRT